MGNDQDHKAEFAGYIQRSHAQLFSYIHSLVHDTADADDIFQQTSMVLWRLFDQFDRTRSFLPWACGIARLEVCGKDLARVVKLRETITAKLRDLGFVYVTLDLLGYRTGSMHEVMV